MDGWIMEYMHQTFPEEDISEVVEFVLRVVALLGRGGIRMQALATKGSLTLKHLYTRMCQRGNE